MHIRNLVGEQYGELWKFVGFVLWCLWMLVTWGTLVGDQRLSLFCNGLAVLICVWEDCSILSEFAGGHRPFSLSNQSCN